MKSFRTLPGLPPYGPPAVAFPDTWGRVAREGLVVEFVAADGAVWVGNFRPGLGGLDDVRQHPNGRDVLVISSDDVWTVDPTTREGVEIAGAADALWPISNPSGIVLSLQGLAFLRLDASGVLWRTRRISWDGFSQIELTDNRLMGVAWSPLDERWVPFSVNLATGRVQGGSYVGTDAEESQKLAE